MNGHDMIRKVRKPPEGLNEILDGCYEPSGGEEKCSGSIHTIMIRLNHAG
jgi:hypothetical protein